MRPQLGDLVRERRFGAVRRAAGKAEATVRRDLRRDLKASAMEARIPTNSTLGQHLAKMEHQRAYASNQAAIAALELATALSTVLTRRFGQDFADEVCRVAAARSRPSGGRFCRPVHGEHRCRARDVAGVEARSLNC
jgi:hypothetical protein